MRERLLFERLYRRSKIRLQSQDCRAFVNDCPVDLLTCQKKIDHMLVIISELGFWLRLAAASGYPPPLVGGMPLDGGMYGGVRGEGISRRTMRCLAK